MDAKRWVILLVSALVVFGSREALARPTTFSAPEPEDRVEELVDRIRFDRLPDIEKMNLTEASLRTAPWSGDYWPIYAGIIARRYADPEFRESKDWKKNRQFSLNRINASSVETLSPAEKYDLLVGDPELTLTRRMWSEGERYYETYGVVEGWMGICEGWAAASIMLPRPRHAVRVTAADGVTEIPFFPSDIKALASLLWSRAAGETRLVGKRCHEKNPKITDGRFAAIECLDTNPATFHLALVNQIGAVNRGFVMDVNQDYEVWNQPIAGYRYSYFNPITEKPSIRWSDARVSLKDFSNDRFAPYRARGAVSVVGVTMEVSYLLETAATAEHEDSESRDRLTQAYFVYDLELDAKGRVVGGEWHRQNHPDFLWIPVAESRAISAGDALLDRQRDRGQWSGSGAIPEAWSAAAVYASRQGQPLARVVEVLVDLSQFAN